MIVPQTFKKAMLTKEGQFTTETFTVSGCRISLLEIGKRILKEHESLGIMRIWRDDSYDSMTEDELSSRLVQLGEESWEGTPCEMRDKLKGMERKRHLMVWGDNSTLLNHAHLLLTVSAIYDEAIYYTNEEMKAKGKENIDVQSPVERPHIYILGRCGTSDVEQLAYIKAREA